MHNNKKIKYYHNVYNHNLSVIGLKAIKRANNGYVL